MKRLLLLVALLLPGCSQDPAEGTVKAFVAYLESGSGTEAWNLLTPETRAVYDSTVAVLQRFGYEESRLALDSLAGGLTPEEFAELSGLDLFLRMVAENPECASLSGRVRSVEHVSEARAVVIVSTSMGPQEVCVELREGRWLLDLTTLTPPAETGR
jgi:hypothetical protein